MTRATALTFCLWLAASSLVAGAEKFEVSKTDDGVVVKLNGQVLTRYLTKSGAKPILWPLIGPYGHEVTRAYPMRGGNPAEREDHVHHRSFWFTHGDVNGISFWHEQADHGTIQHREFLKSTGGEQAVIKTRNDWIGPDGTKICEDVRTLTFGADGDRRWIDFDVTVEATNGKVVFGDTKEGSFGVRVAGTMKVDSKPGGKIVNSAGQTDGEAWGKAAEWVDYFGPLEGKTVGIAIMNHPESFRFPTHWHVRTYGLFAANPFGLHDFKGSEDVDGSATLQPGESFTLNYRVLVHAGDTQQADIAEAYKAYASQPRAN